MEKALFPILVMVSGNTISVSSVQTSNALSPIAVTVQDSTVFGTVTDVRVVSVSLLTVALPVW